MAAAAERGSLSFGSLPDSDERDDERCFPIFGLLTPAW